MTATLLSRRSPFVLLVVLILYPIAGCGGGGRDDSGVAPPALRELDSARFDVNVVTGAVKVIQDQGEVSTSAVWTGTGVTLNSTQLLSQAGNPGRRGLKVSLTNHMPETIGNASSGIRVVITGFTLVLGGGSEPLQVSNPDDVLPSANATGGMNPGLPYFQYGGPLGPGVTSPVKEWWFTVPSGITSFSFTTSVQADTQGLVGLPSTSGTGTGSPLVSVQTVAGCSRAGHRDGHGASALFTTVYDLALDGAGNLYIGDSTTVRRLAPSGVVSTLAGAPGESGGTCGAGYLARFVGARGVAVSADGSTIFVADAAHTIRLLLRNPDGTYDVSTIAGAVSTPGYAEGYGSAARFQSPTGLAYDEAAQTLFISETLGHRVRSLRCVNPGAMTAPTSWRSGLIAGSTAGLGGSTDSLGSGARFNQPADLALARDGRLYVADCNNNRIRCITPDTQVTTVAGSTEGFADGTGTAAKFDLARSLAVDRSGWLYVGDWGNLIVRRVSPAGAVTTVAGANGVSGHIDGTGATARFAHVTACAEDSRGNLYISDNDTRIRVLTPILNVAGTL